MSGTAPSQPASTTLPADSDHVASLRQILHQRKFRFFSVDVSPFTLKEVCDYAVKAMQTRTRIENAIVDVTVTVTARNDKELRNDINNADIAIIDGMGVVWGGRLLGHEVPGRVTGTELMWKLFDACSRKGLKPYILGAKQDILEKAITNAKERFPDLELAGYRNGYFDLDDLSIVEEINRAKPDCLLLGITTRMKARFLNRYRDKLDVPYILALGGNIDILAGNVRKAPLWMQKAGMEWIWRIIQEPRRLFWRYMTANGTFLLMMLGALLRRPFRRLSGRR